MKETETTELKKSLTELTAGLGSISAILNKHGHGELWFGIRNDGKAVGLEVNDIEALKMIEVSGSRKKVPKRKFLKESSGKTAQRILALMGENPVVTTEQIGEKLGISGRAVRKQIANLRAAKQLLRTGGRKLGRWEVLK